ncbi:MAG: class I SAM-dependent methyltransferase [Burkholderiaceae bacterium]|jgi:SAM-dependent methyltransferase|nr:class I SAM-dependent methyltransferase [Burkholderiaceae bacterium]
MKARIIGLDDWLQTPPGRYLLAWEQACFDQTVTDIFGYHALQLGLTGLNGLHNNRIAHRWLALEQAQAPGPGSPPDDRPEPPKSQPRARAAFITDFTALPFPATSLDLVALPHTLELSTNPHAALREIERVLVPEGRVILSGFNPYSLWGFRQKRARLYRRLGWDDFYLPATSELITFRRLRDWLHLLSFEIESEHFGVYQPAVRSAQRLEQLRWFDAAGARWWPIFGAVYFIVAIKRVRGLTLLPVQWKRKPARATAPVTAARHLRHSQWSAHL